MSQESRRSMSLVESKGGKARPSKPKNRAAMRPSGRASGALPAPEPLGGTHDIRWPHCPYANRTCLLYDMAGTMGRNIHETLITFILAAEEGARLTLQRNRDGFTVQVTRAVLKTAKDPSDAPGLWALRSNLGVSDPTVQEG